LPALARILCGFPGNVFSFLKRGSHDRDTHASISQKKSCIVVTDTFFVGSIMSTHYEKIIRDNLAQVYRKFDELERCLPAMKRGRQFHFRAFGEDCLLDPDGVSFSERPENGPKALLVSLYARYVRPDPVGLDPFKSFKDLPGSMPYHGAFAVNSERVLVPHVPGIEKNQKKILKFFEGEGNPKGAAGDFSLLLYPLPKIALCYVFYRADDEFPPSVTCLFSANADVMMPLDGLADVAEYTSKEMIRMALNEP